MAEKSGSPLKNIVVEFDLPFVLRVVDSIKRETVPDGYQHYFSAINGIPAMLRFEKRLRDLGGIQVATEDKIGLFLLENA